jgi:hypothetical protein
MFSGCVEDRRIVFFDCTSSADLWETLNLNSVVDLTDANVWTGCPHSHLDSKLWPFCVSYYSLVDLGC